MTSIDIFSRIELPKKEVFNCFLEADTFKRCVSPFFTIENFTSTTSTIDINTYFSLKCALLDLLQFFVTIKEIIPGEKIVFDLNGLIKGTQTIYFIDDGNHTLLREKFEFSLYNQFNLPVLSLILSIFFYIDACIKHLRLRNVLYKNSQLTLDQRKNNFKDLFAIRSYIVVEADINEINLLFQDLNKFSLWLSPFVKIDLLNGKNEFTFSLPLLGAFQCRINKNDSNKVEISFASSILNGINTWSILPCEKEIVIENTLEIDDSSVYLKLLWLLLGNSLVRIELNNWNKRLKDIVEKTNLYKDVFQHNLSPNPAGL